MIKISNCGKILSAILSRKELDTLSRKSFGERHKIMQERAKRCTEERKK